ncbi:hypothetical protein JKG68_06700 [Microvirga aerilata]|uniref:Uncharacterized protein n=1 Tax=Microvirga aerilata TaxID=670292 RepID=A0A937CXA2_9HYPH|nr:hypothetical protein [Microvirga aerilata]MBL0403649.1 hypothetical protein [Microvirga aerilata]
MSEDFVWSLAADVATVGATAIAAIGLIWTALSLRASTRASDLNSLFLMTGHITAAEARLFASRDDPIQQDVDFNNYLNMLETLAAAINGGLFGSVSSKIASDRLCNDIAILMSSDWSRQRIERAVTSPETFCEIQSSTGKTRNGSKVM